MKLLRHILLASFLQGAVATPSLRSLQTTGSQKGLIDLVELVAFDVDIILREDVAIEPFEITNIVTDWMNDSFQKHLNLFGYTEANAFAAFDTVILLDRQRNLRAEEDQLQERQLQTDPLFEDKTRFSGAALFTRLPSSQSVPEGDVLAIQQLVLLNETGLLVGLQSSQADGLGGTVLNVQAYLNPVEPTSASSDSNQLELVIVVAIVVAAVAFLFLLVAIGWAWRHDRKNRSAYLVGNQGASQKAVSDRPDRTGSDTTMEEEARNSPVTRREQHNPYPKEIGGVGAVVEMPGRYSSGDYPESMISDDINTSLSEYYRSGLGGQVMSSGDHARNVMNQNHAFNDAASISSMESYGYSLDGYAPSFATNPVDGMVYATPGSSNVESPPRGERVGDLPVEPAEATIREKIEAEMAAIGMSRPDGLNIVGMAPSRKYEEERPPSPTEPESVSVENASVTPSDEGTQP